MNWTIFIIGLIATSTTVVFWVRKAARKKCGLCHGFTVENMVCPRCKGTGEQQ